MPTTGTPKAKISPILELILSTLTGALTTVGESKLEVLLQKLHDNHPELYPACLKAGQAFFTPLQKLAEGTPTHIDDAVLEAIELAVTNSAETNGVTL